MSLMQTPRSNRLHIGIYGKRNSGKSSLINALTGQKAALVSDVAGTTTDPVYKTMEIHGLGPCVFIDTAGFDDEGELGKMRVEKTEKELLKTDIALIICTSLDIQEEIQWIQKLKKKSVPVVLVMNKSDILSTPHEMMAQVKQQTGLTPILASAKEKQGMDEIKAALIQNLPKEWEPESITGDLVQEGDCVLLVMPQDIQAPKGRLILPQVQTIRDLLDKKCVVISVTTDKLENALANLTVPPKLIITDSQVFQTVYEKKPKESRLTSFSILLAGYKGDIAYYKESVKAIETLTEESKVLIAEACTHAPLTEDIGREKIPRMLKKKIGTGLSIDIVSGSDFPKDLDDYDLVIQCGACMFNRRYVMSRIDQAKGQGVPMTNYGIVMAYLSGILEKVDL